MKALLIGGTLLLGVTLMGCGEEDTTDLDDPSGPPRGIITAKWRNVDGGRSWARNYEVEVRDCQGRTDIYDMPRERWAELAVGDQVGHPCVD